MSARKDWREVPIPDRMAKLDRDARGYPIPFIVLRNPGDGHPNFTINDSLKRQRCIGDDLCSICGGKLFRGRWFVGGPLAAFHPHGAYIDPPVHDDCARYALRVCPYLAAPRYNGRLDAIGFAWEQHVGMGMLVDQTMLPDRPEVFVAVMAVGQDLVGRPLDPYIKPRNPYRGIEFWRGGEKLDDREGTALARAAIEATTAKEAAGELKLQPPRLITRPAGG